MSRGAAPDAGGYSDLNPLWGKGETSCLVEWQGQAPTGEGKNSPTLGADSVHSQVKMQWTHKEADVSEAERPLLLPQCILCLHPGATTSESANLVIMFQCSYHGKTHTWVSFLLQKCIHRHVIFFK